MLFGCKQIESIERETVRADMRSANWLVWIGKSGKAIALVTALDALWLDRQDFEFGPLWWNLPGSTCYPRKNTPFLL